jgi:hypothetical protein
MPYRGGSEDHRLDRMLRACDPIDGRALSDPGLVAAFDWMSALIVSEPRRVRWWRFAKRPRAALAGVAVFALLGAGVALAATNLFVPTHTHQYPPKGMVPGGGPGELLNIAGTDFHQVALEVSADITYPPGYESWRESVISFEYMQPSACPPGSPHGCTPKIPAGALHGAFAASAFCAWLLDWRHDVASGRLALAARAAQVISGALQWKAVRDWDPHPSMSVPGDMGSSHPSPFGWMIPFIEAVRADDLSRVNQAIVSDANYGGQFALWADTGMGLSLRRNLVGRPLLTYLDRHGS